MVRLITKKICVSAALFVLVISTAMAQQRIGTVSVRVTLDHANWLYQPGETVKAKISVIQDGQPVPDANVTYSFGPEMMPPISEKAMTVPLAGLMIEAGTMKEAGFLRIIATTEMYGRKYRGLATAGFAPETIKPTQTGDTFTIARAAGRTCFVPLVKDRCARKKKLKLPDIMTSSILRDG